MSVYIAIYQTAQIKDTSTDIIMTVAETLRNLSRLSSHNGEICYILSIHRLTYNPQFHTF